MTRLPRKNAIPLSDLLDEFVRANGLSEGLKRHRIYKAWDDASGAGPYTLKKFFRDGRLFITLNSSVVRSQLLFQKQALIEKINSLTSSDAVKELILK